MPRNDLGKLRRSQIVTTAGPGAILDFRTEKGAVSGLCLGLEQWPKGTLIHEARLERRLRVAELRMPPAFLDGDPPQGEPLPAMRFPRWLQCPQCNELQWHTSWGRDPGEAVFYCAPCSARQAKRVSVIAAPFVTACEKGHLDEFPWAGWASHAENCPDRQRYTLKSEGSGGLAGLRLTCLGCRKSVSMEGSFNPDALQRFGRCSGERPWLPNAPAEACELERRTLQRGASNMYFPVIASALDIPPWSDGIQQKLRRDWDRILKFGDEQLRELIRVVGLHEQVNMTEEELFRELKRRKAQLERESPADLRADEYRQLAADVELPRDEACEFEVRVEKVPAEIRPWVSRLVRVVRLREVRVLRAFTRVRYPDPETPEHLPEWATLSERPLHWLPAVEVRGEGIFVELNPERIATWSATVQERADRINAAFLQDWQRRHEDAAPPFQVTPKVLLVHSLAHALIRQLSLECGYAAASLRERLYFDEGCSGLLVYTAAPDSDGTLGGLARQGRADAFVAILEGALRSQLWCAADPLCISGIHSQSEQASGAACHACLLVSETSCEQFNRLLDRQTLVGVPERPGVGFFHGCDLLR